MNRSIPIAAATLIWRGVVWSGVVWSGASAAAPPRSADAIVDQYCNACHATGWDGAPVSGDRNAWQQRVAAGFDSLFKNAKQDLNTMPPMGTCMDCTDEELRAAIRKLLP